MANVKNCKKTAVWLPDDLAERLRQISQQTGIQQSVIMKRGIEKELDSLQPIVKHMTETESCKPTSNS